MQILGIYRQLSFYQLLVLTLAASVSVAETPPSYSFDRLLPEHGLSSVTVYSLLQDRTGFLWVGTEAGLNRYDGYAFEVFRHDPNEPSSLASNDISFMLEDDAGQLWLATWGGGLERFDPVSRTVQHYRRDATRPDGLEGDRVQHLLEDSSGVLWVGTGGTGLARFDRESGLFETFRHDPTDPRSLCQDRVWRILEDPLNILWIATGGGLCVFDRASETFIRYRHVAGDPQSLSDDQVRTLYVDRLGSLWVGTGNGLNRFDRGTTSFERFEARPGGLSHRVITAIYEDSRGTLWVGTRGGGLNILDRATGQWLTLRHDPNDPNSLSDDDIRAILEDRSGVLWIATRRGGLNKLDLKPSKFEYVGPSPGPDGLGNAQVRAFAEDPAGRLWIGTAEGVYRGEAAGDRLTEPGKGPDTEFLSAEDIHHLLFSRSGDLWVAVGRDLHRLPGDGSDAVSYRHRDDAPQSLADGRVMALFEDSAGNLWVGTDAGLDRFEGQGRFQHLRVSDRGSGSAGGESVTALCGGRDGSLWVGTALGGLRRLDIASGRFESYFNDSSDPTSLSNNWVLALHRHASGTLWVGTANGLNELRSDGTFRRYLQQDGLIHPQVSSILGDDEGRLWIASPRGLSRFDPSTGVFRDYFERDGLRSGPFHPGAAIARRDGVLCFGGSNGYNCFDPQRVVDNPHAPPVVLTGFESLGSRIDFGRSAWAVEDIRVSHQESFFTFELAALDFTDPQANRYRYRLEGYDRDWIEAGSRRTASYSNVAPGTYVFRARGANSDGVWSADGPEVTLSIKPPFWKTIWFSSLLIVGFFSLGGVGYNYRIRHLRRREQELSRRLDEGMADLRRSEERYRLLFERNLAGVVRATTGGRIIDCNEAFARIHGYDSPAECQANHRLALSDTPGAQPSVLAMLRDVGAVVGYEASAQRRDGAMVSLLWNANLIAGDADQPPVVEGTVIDVSERRRIEEGLRRAQKLESLGVLAGGIAHDFNNLLMSILGNAELGRIGLDTESGVYQRLEKIEAAAQRASELSSKMLAYSGKGEFVVSRVDLAAAVREMAHLLEGAVAKKTQLIFELESGLPMVEADVEQVEQVLMSLVTNASEALGNTGGTITVGCAAGDYSNEDLADTYLDDRLPAGFYVALEVRDDGCGMDEDLQLRIFDPFFSTKFTGRGLGLAAVLGIVRGHRGAIKIDSEPGRGSVFTILFPAAMEQSSATIDAPIARAAASGQTTVLVVDDDESVRNVAHDMVETLGFDVLSASNGLEGLEIFRRRADDIVLVILDLAMPKMSGEEAFHAIREISPAARVILASGYDERESTRLFAGQGLSGFIQKPYRLRNLKAKIEEVLGS